MARRLRATARRYAARGQRQGIAYGNHTSTAYTYDPARFWLTRLHTTRASTSTHGAATLQDLTYTRDLVGNPTAIADDAQETLYFANTQVSPTRTFAYDALYRLVRAEGREKDGLTQTTHELPAMGGLPDSGNPALRRYTQSYEYDGVGNLLEMKHQLGSGGSVLWKRDYTYASGSNRLLTTSMGQSSLSYDYDARGALSNLPHLEGFTRDFRDQLRRVVLGLAGNEAWYAHDGAGQRVRKLVDKGAVTEERIYVGGWEVWRKRVNGTLDEERTTLHVRDGERRVAMVETKTVAGGQAVGSPVARWRFQLDDQLGSVVSECDEEGGVFSYEELHPYGSVAWSAVDAALDVSPRRYRYTGMERDEETGLQAHGVRMYAPWLGRWDRPDPIGLGDGVNRWGYAHQSPSARSDTNGRESPPPEDTHHRPDPSEPEEVFIYAEHGVERMGIGEFLMLPFAKPVQEFTAWYASKTPAGRLMRRAAEAYPEEAAGVAGAVELLTDNEAARVFDDATFGLTGVAVAKQGWRALAKETLPSGSRAPADTERAVIGVRRSQTGGGLDDDAADAAYEAIRASTTDVDAIANSTGFKAANIEKVKQHVFFDEHLLDSYVDYGVPAEVRRFDSSAGQAAAWRRLEAGTHTADDIRWLKHEMAERWWMKNVTPSYADSHRKAQATYPAPRLE